MEIGNERMEWENGMNRECGWENSSDETPPSHMPDIEVKGPKQEIASSNR